jgi:hypothetical protein
MRDLLVIWDVTFSPGTTEQLGRGLLGFVACTLNGGLRVDGIMVQRERDGRVLLKFPTRMDSNGRRHPIIRPLGKQALAEVERQVFSGLRAQGTLA